MMDGLEAKKKGDGLQKSNCSFSVQGAAPTFFSLFDPFDTRQMESDALLYGEKSCRRFRCDLVGRIGEGQFSGHGDCSSSD